MDCYSVESEFIESLDFLSPPVKRIHNSREAFRSAYHNEANDVHLLRGLRNKFARRAPSSTKNSRTIKTNAESSTSLILKRTSERKILEQYSIVSYTSLQGADDDPPEKAERILNSEKPLIKVTVIPKTDQIHTAKILRKRRYIPSRVESTKSNHENSIQTKNVYLIVAGRRKEKIYEIKTTGSATLSTDHDSCVKDEEVPIKELSNFKHLIQSLNMDRKKKKETPTPSVEPAPNFTEGDMRKDSCTWRGGYPRCDDCLCTCNPTDEPKKKSRVRIFGQFGISEDDKYVLRYGATVNNKEVLSDVAKLARDFSPILPMNSNATQDTEPQIDSCIQADYDNFENESPVRDKASCMESQGTQVNFNVQLATTKGNHARYSDKKVQCSGYNMSNRSEHILKDCQSPLVIISVYPKQNPEDITRSFQIPAKHVPSPPILNTYTSSPVLKMNKPPKRSDAETKLSSKRPSRSRSPSPTKKTSRLILQEDKASKQRVIDKKSLERQKALKALKQKIQEKDKLKQDAGTKKTSKFNSAHSTQFSKILQNVTVSNATQISKNKHNIIASNGTQISRSGPPSSDATLFSNPQSFTVSNGMQCVDGPNLLAPIKHSKNIMVHPQNTLTNPKITRVTNASTVLNSQKQLPKPHVFVSNATQVSKNGDFTVSNGTQVSRNKQHFIPSRESKHQETFTSTHPVKTISNEQGPRPVLKIIVERGTNTDHARAKRVLVDTYTQKLTEKMNQMDFPDNYDNLNGDQEHYDVLYNQDGVTDITIRTKMREMASQKSNENDLYPSIENSLYVQDRVADKGLSEDKTKSLSVTLCQAQSDETALTKHVSRLTIRDSLEISHRREDKGNANNNIKNTQTCFTSQISENIPTETEFSAPIKHYTGDDCSIINPIERDKQIRELLGVQKNKIPFKKRARHCDNDDQFPYRCFYRQECKKSQVTEINFQFQNVCPCYKPILRGKQKSVQSASVQCRYSNDTNVSKCYVSRVRYVDDVKKGNFGEAQYAVYDNYNNDERHRNNCSRCNEVVKEQSNIYQQLVLNRNVQVFLQVDQFSKQKPIVLSRKQYDKVKKTIQKTICKKRSSDEKRRKSVSIKSEKSVVSVGIVRPKQFYDAKLYNEKEAQTDLFPCNSDNCRNEKHKTDIWNCTVRTRNVKSGTNHSSPDQSRDQSRNGAEEKTRNTSQNPEISVERHHVRHHRSHGRKKRRASEQHRERKAKRCTKGHRKGGPSTHASLSSIENDGKRQKDKEPKAARTVRSPHQRNTKTQVELCGDQKGDKGLERLSEQAERHISEQYSVQKENYSDQKNSYIDQKESIVERYNDNNENHSPERYNEYNENHSPERYNERKENRKMKTRDSGMCNNEYERLHEGDTKDRKEVKTLILFNADNIKGNLKNVKEAENDFHTKKTLSSMEIRYSSVGYMKQVAYSSTDIGALSDSSIAHVNSFRTIFRGHRKSPTPNLGTSAYSLYSEDVLNSDTKCTKFIMEPRDSKPKKPFLRRLMSCLVMRSTRDSELKLPTGPVPDIPSVNSSIDSYHISTSLGAVEVSSSIYDTSASFYSNHTILPVNSKIKRGFFSSVRGFLTNRKS